MPDGPSDNTSGEARVNAELDRPARHVICPHCRNAIELILDAGPEEVLCPSCGSSILLERGSTTAWNPRDGRRKLGRFELIDFVGMGAFGSVYKARDRELDRTVAIKVPRAGNLAGADDLDRFVREARSAAQLRHPSIVTIHEVGHEDGVPYLVSDFVEGTTLADLLTARRPEPREAAQMIAAVADALQYAHERGVVHRDVKPSNIMLGDDGRPHLMDFGLAKREAGEITITIDGQVLGTPAYMSPEQARGEAHRVDGRSDVYSLGVILYQLLTGALPFRGNSRMLLHQVLHDDPRPPRKLNAHIPRDLETICLKAMAKVPGRRYATAAAVADELRRFLNGEPIKARRASELERAARWVRRRPAVAALIALTLLVIGVGGSVGAWVWSREAESRRRDEAKRLADEETRQVRIEYYANVTKRWGIPEGIGRLTEEQARHRAITYKLSRRGGRVEALEYVNGAGRPRTPTGLALVSDLDDLASLRATASDFRTPYDEQTPECRIEYHRNDEGRLIQELAHNRAGEVVWAFHHPTSSVAHFADKQGFPKARAGSGASYVQLTWSADGLENEVHYLDMRGKRRQDGEGIFGVRKRFDGRGLPVEVTYLNAEDRPTLNKDGYAQFTAIYDEQGNYREVAFRDVQGRPALNHGRYARLVCDYDRWGNRIAAASFDLDGKLVPSDNTGRRCRWTMTFDDRGNQVEYAAFGPDGQPTLDTGGYARVASTYDERGYLVGSRYLGLDGQPLLRAQGYAGVNVTHDDRGYRTRTEYLGLDGKPIVARFGYACETDQYDDRGNCTEVAFSGLDGKPAIGWLGYARLTAVFDEGGNRTGGNYFGVDGKPIFSRSGYAGSITRRDERGNVIEQSYFGVDGKPVAARDGVARITWAYDDRGYQTERCYFGPDGTPVLHADGCARDTVTFDDRGRLIAQAFFGLDGKPVLCIYGFASHTISYDSRGHLLGRAYFGLDGRPTLSKNGYARYAFTYDSANTLADASFFDLNEKPLRTRVVVGGAARANATEKTGLQTGDVLVTYDGLKLDCAARLLSLKSSEPAGGKPKELGLLRDGRPFALPLRSGPIYWDYELETQAIPEHK